MMTTLMKRTRRRTPIGVDIGSTGVRAVQLVRTGERFDVLRSAASDRPSAGDDGAGRARSAWIRECLRKADFHGRSAVTGLNTPEADFHLLELPKAVLAGASAECDAAVHWEIVRLMGASPQTIEVRHWPLPAASAAAPNALGVGAPRACIESALSSCAWAGLRCRAIDTTATALSRFGCLLAHRPAEVVWGMLDLGHRQTRLLLCVGEAPVLVRNVGSGGAEWTQRIAETLRLSPKAAEIHKRQHGIARTARGRRQDGSSAQDGELGVILLNALRGDLNEIAGEVKRSYDYALSCYAKHAVGELMLVGGGAQTANLAEFWGNVLGIPVRRASSYLDEGSCRLRYATAQGHAVEMLAAAIGLAIEFDE
jgi:Tfp pilus assembly PilM family ATPase